MYFLSHLFVMYYWTEEGKHEINGSKLYGCLDAYAGVSLNG